MAHGARSRSMPPSRPRSRSEPEEEQPLSPFPSWSPENEGDDEDDEATNNTPRWLRELALAGPNRHSRASSIVSTRTRFSTTTLDEVRSIEISAGNQTFRISRDGSRVTDTTAPPPYTGPSWVEGSEPAAEVDSDHVDAASDHSDQNSDDEQEVPQEQAQTKARGKRVRIVMPDEEIEDDTHAESSSQAEPAPKSGNHVLTRADLYQLLLDLPLQLKRVLGLRPSAQSPSVLTAPGTGEPDSLSRPRPTSSQSLPDSFTLHEPRVGDQPPPEGKHKRGERASSSSKVVPMPPETAQTPSESPDLSVPLTIMDLNELSLVYNRVIKDLDREHRKQLHERDRELAELRFLLNEKDVIYRQQLKGKDFVIDDLRQRLEHNEDTMNVKLERARFEVEDLWENRWKERDRHLMDRMKRIEEAMKGSVMSNDEES